MTIYQQCDQQRHLVAIWQEDTAGRILATRIADQSVHPYSSLTESARAGGPDTIPGALTVFTAGGAEQEVLRFLQGEGAMTHEPQQGFFPRGLWREGDDGLISLGRERYPELPDVERECYARFCEGGLDLFTRWTNDKGEPDSLGLTSEELLVLIASGIDRYPGVRTVVYEALGISLSHVSPLLLQGHSFYPYPCCPAEAGLGSFQVPYGRDVWSGETFACFYQPFPLAGPDFVPDLSISARSTITLGYRVWRGDGPGIAWLLPFSHIALSRLALAAFSQFPGMKTALHASLVFGASFIRPSEQPMRKE